MNKKNRKTLELIFKRPTPSNLRWDDIEALLINLKAEISEGNGSRVRIQLERYSIGLIQQEKLIKVRLYQCANF